MPPPRPQQTICRGIASAVGSPAAHGSGVSHWQQLTRQAFADVTHHRHCFACLILPEIRSVRMHILSCSRSLAESVSRHPQCRADANLQVAGAQLITHHNFSSSGV